MLFYQGSLLTGVEASAAQNSPVTKTCSQCGAVLPSSVRTCKFCDSSFSVSFSSVEEPLDNHTGANLALSADATQPGIDPSRDHSAITPAVPQDATWRGELAQRLEAYRHRRGKVKPNAAQSQFSFDAPSDETSLRASVEIAEPLAAVGEDFSFTIAIGRPSKKPAVEESRMVIDVSLPPDDEARPQTQLAEVESSSQPGLHPVALLMTA